MTPPRSNVLHTMTTWRSLLAWLGVSRHVAVCGTDFHDEPMPPDCPDCTAQLNHRTKTSSLVKVTALAILVLVTTTACDWTDKVSEPFRDAPRSATTNSDAADVIEMPNGFSNLATKCDHGNRVYVAYHGDSPYAALHVVAADPTCKH